MGEEEKKYFLGNTEIFLPFISFLFTALLKYLHSPSEIKDGLFDITFDHISQLLDLGRQKITQQQTTNLQDLQSGYISLFLSISKDSYHIQATENIIYLRIFLFILTKMLKSKDNRTVIQNYKEILYIHNKLLRYLTPKFFNQQIQLILENLFDQISTITYRLIVENDLTYINLLLLLFSFFRKKEIMKKFMTNLYTG